MSEAAEQPAPEQPAAAPVAPPAKRVVLTRAARVPLPRRLIATALLFAVLALALHALPRPLQPLPTSVVNGIGDDNDRLRAVYRAPLPENPDGARGFASAEERRAYSWELWRYSRIGVMRELLLRWSERLAALCLFGAIVAAGVQRRRDRIASASRGERQAPELLHEERI